MEGNVIAWWNIKRGRGRRGGAPVSRTGEELEELRDGVQEVYNLRDEEHEKCLAEVTVYPNDCKGHAREVTKGVSNEDRGREPVVAEECQRRADEREHE